MVVVERSCEVTVDVVVDAVPLLPLAAVAAAYAASFGALDVAGVAYRAYHTHGTLRRSEGYMGRQITKETKS